MALSAILSGLSTAAGAINNIASPVSSILGAIRGFKGAESVQATPASSSERYAIDLLKEISDPNSELVAQLTESEAQSLRNALNEGLRGQVLADRRERSLGRSNVFFDPERQDEAIAYQLSRGAPYIEQSARANAINRILSSATGVGRYSPLGQERIRGDIAARGALESENAVRNQNLPQTIQTSIDQILNTVKGTPPFNPYGNDPYKTYFPNSGLTVNYNQPRY